MFETYQKKKKKKKKKNPNFKDFLENFRKLSGLFIGLMGKEIMRKHLYLGTHKSERKIFKLYSLKQIDYQRKVQNFKGLNGRTVRNDKLLWYKETQHCSLGWWQLLSAYKSQREKHKIRIKILKKIK